MIKKGDRVRFLNAIGGGIVTRIDEKKNLIFVEDADGFEIPVLERECVKIGVVNSETNFPVKDFKSKKETVQPDTKEETKPIVQVVENKEIYETTEGETLKALLAFFPVDIKQLQTTSYECYLVNDSNYFLYYNIVAGEINTRRSIANGTIEPNIQELLSEISKDKLNEWEQIRVQLLPFKKGKIILHNR
jgi:sulfur carrier protein ThiS